MGASAHETKAPLHINGNGAYRRTEEPTILASKYSAFDESVRRTKKAAKRAEVV